MQLIRIVIAGDCRLCGEGLRRILVSDPGFDVVGAGDGAGLRELAQQTRPDILLVDSRLPDPLLVPAHLKHEGIPARMILVAAGNDDEWALAALHAGVRGILTRDASPDDLAKAIRVVHEGQIWARQAVVARLVEEAADHSDTKRARSSRLNHSLSAREKEVVRLAADGLSNKEIADRLGMSLGTVKAHLTSIFRKLGLRDRVQLAGLYHGTPIE
jgi:DNA-binding NarL/FixJ family response regulator